MWIKKKEWENIKNKLDRLYSGHSFEGFYIPIGEPIDYEDFRAQMNQYHLILRHKNESISTQTIPDLTLEELARFVIDGTPIKRKQEVDVEFRGE